MFMMLFFSLNLNNKSPIIKSMPFNNISKIFKKLKYIKKFSSSLSSNIYILFSNKYIMFEKTFIKILVYRYGRCKEFWVIVNYPSLKK